MRTYEFISQRVPLVFLNRIVLRCLFGWKVEGYTSARTVDGKWLVRLLISRESPFLHVLDNGRVRKFRVYDRLGFSDFVRLVLILARARRVPIYIHIAAE